MPIPDSNLRLRTVTGGRPFLLHEQVLPLPENPLDLGLFQTCELYFCGYLILPSI